MSSLSLPPRPKTKSLYKPLRSIIYACSKFVDRAGKAANVELNPRFWSNTLLREVAPLIHGSVVNVSGWQDKDRETGSRYRDYFVHAGAYAITYYPGGEARSKDPSVESLPLDLEADLPQDMTGRFDCVFNHTVLEHVANAEKAFDVLCGLTNDLVILVVPFAQHQHYDTGSYGDYWRFSPMALEYAFQKRGLEVLTLDANDQPWWPIYVFAVASKHPEKWRGKLPGKAIANIKIGEKLFKP